MKILFSSLVACTLCALFAFSSKVYLNSPNISMEKMVKYTVQYKNGATSTRLLSTTFFTVFQQCDHALRCKRPTDSPQH